jgi:hypothetical protein
MARFYTATEAAGRWFPAAKTAAPECFRTEKIGNPVDAHQVKTVTFPELFCTTSTLEPNG